MFDTLFDTGGFKADIYEEVPAVFIGFIILEVTGFLLFIGVTKTLMAVAVPSLLALLFGAGLVVAGEAYRDGFRAGTRENERTHDLRCIGAGILASTVPLTICGLLYAIPALTVSAGLGAMLGAGLLSGELGFRYGYGFGLRYRPVLSRGPSIGPP